MAFLQRVTNGGGRIDREYAAGRGRMDLLVEYNGKKNVVEIKMVHERQSADIVTEKGLEQTARYRDAKSPGSPAYLVIFDRRGSAKEKTWEERISWNMAGNITIVGC